jgi:hypothetical protein
MDAASLIRRKDWRSRLTAAVDGFRGVPFAWDGIHDCGMFFAAGVEAVTGVDIAAPLRGRYWSKSGAFRALRDLGFEDHVAYVASILPELGNPAMARAGDGVVIETEDGPALAIVTGATIACYGPAGLGFVSFGSHVRAFRIG